MGAEGANEAAERRTSRQERRRTWFVRRSLLARSDPCNMLYRGVGDGRVAERWRGRSDRGSLRANRLAASRCVDPASSLVKWQQALWLGRVENIPKKSRTCEGHRRRPGPSVARQGRWTGSELSVSPCRRVARSAHSAHSSDMRGDGWARRAQVVVKILALGSASELRTIADGGSCVRFSVNRNWKRGETEKSSCCQEILFDRIS